MERRLDKLGRMTLRAVRWAIVIVGGMLVILALIAGAGSRTVTLRQLVIDTLAGTDTTDSSGLAPNTVGLTVL